MPKCQVEFDITVDEQQLLRELSYEFEGKLDLLIQKWVKEKLYSLSNK